MNERIREKNMVGVHLQMHLETHAAQTNALECLQSSEYHVCNLFQLQLYTCHMSVFTDYLVIYFRVGMQQMTRKQKQV